MMERNGKITLILGLLVIILLGWTLYLREKPQHSTPMQQNSLPDYKSAQMQTSVYDTTGNLLYKLQSKTVNYYKKENITLFSDPIVTMFDHNLQPEWRITAKQAKLSGKKMVYLSGDVNAVNLGNDSQIKSIHTEQAQLNLETEDISSKDKVKIEGNQFHSQGIGLKGNLKQKKATLLSEVNTDYE